MARMKFLCDAERCIECNGCVTACKQEHDIRGGLNRRRVVTINDGVPGERSISVACMHCSDAPCMAVCPVDCFYRTDDGRRAARQGPLHRLRVLFLRLSVRRAAVPAGGRVRRARQDGQVHVLRRRPGAQQLRSRIQEVRPQSSCRGQAARLRRDVLDQGADRRRWRCARRNLSPARDHARQGAARSGAGPRRTAGRRHPKARPVRRRPRAPAAPAAGAKS